MASLLFLGGSVGAVVMLLGGLACHKAFVVVCAVVAFPCFAWLGALGTFRVVKLFRSELRDQRGDAMIRG
jgi:hypothetical protein